MLNALIAEFGGPSPVRIDILLIRMAGAVLLCGLIGLEREFHKNTAGLRTNMLIGLAAVVFSVVTLHLMDTAARFGNGTVQIDPVRLVEAVTAGIAFLAAGVVVYTRGTVKGLTTGASMWLSAAIGLCAGLGLWPVAIIATALGFVILAILRRIQYVAGIKDE